MFAELKRKIFRQEHKDRYEKSRDIFGTTDLNIVSPAIESRQRVSWLEESFVDYSEEEVSNTRKNYLGIGLANKHFVVFLCFVFFLIFLLLGRTAYLQIYRGNYYIGIAEKNRIRIVNLVSPRGIIYDLNGKALVKNVPSFSLFITPFDFSFNEEVKRQNIDWLAESLEDGTIKEKINKILELAPNKREYFEPIILLEDISYEKALSLEVDLISHPGVSIEVVSKRDYLKNWNGINVLSLSHVLGYEGKIDEEEYVDLREQGYLFNDYIGKAGIEDAFETMLRGQYGKEQIEIDSTGKKMKILARESLVKGNNVYLSIDLEMQTKLEEVMTNYMTRAGKKRASAIVMNPQTGKLYCLISLPSYDNNLFSRNISATDYQNLLEDVDKPLFNRVISGEFPSGSTIKPVISVAALEEGIINENTSFLSVGGIRIGQWFFPDWKAGGHGITNVRKAIAESVNTFYYIIGGGYGNSPGLGVYKIKEYAEKFGLFALTGIDLPGEKKGFLPTPEWKRETKDETWYIGDTYHLAIGQGDLLATPLQVANYTTAFANGGKLMKPEIVDRYYDQVEMKEKTIQPVVLREDMVKTDNLEIVRQGMRQAVTSGSARILNSLPVTAAAKTGTAQWGVEKSPHSWFTSFAPYDNAELVVTILVEEGGDGTAIAAPIAFEFMNWYFRTYKK